MNVRATLETVAKRWKGKKRPNATQSIILVCDGATSMQFLADLVVAMRPHFSDVALSAGFE